MARQLSTMLAGPGLVGLRPRLATDRFDVVAVRVPDEAREVIGVVFGEEPWSVKDLGVDAQRCAVKLANGIVVWGSEGKMELPPLVSWCWTQPERGVASYGKPHRGAIGVGGAQSQRCQHPLVKRPAGSDVGDLERKVIEHRNDGSSVDETVAALGFS